MTMGLFARPSTTHARRYISVSRGSIVLVGRSPELAGLRWQSEARLRIGRFTGDTDVVISDVSISPYHAEVVLTREGWMVRDLGSKAGTFVNGRPLIGRQQPLRDSDELRLGRVVLGVSVLAPEPGSEAAAEAAPPPVVPSAVAPDAIRTTRSFLRVQASSRHSWEEAIDSVNGSAGKGPWQDRHVRALLRAGYAVCKVASLDDLLQSVLQDLATSLEAQRGAIVLENEQTGQLELRAVHVSRPMVRAKGTHSHTLAVRCFSNGESLLCRDTAASQEVREVPSVAAGSMTSIICALLRSPRQRLGVLHLDRGPLQDPFRLEEFHLADAMAATVSVGIESALLIDRQRQQFMQTVAALGRAVEIRDTYTANHTHRVTSYSLLLARELRLPAADLQKLQIGTPLHDIGKIGIDDAILRKPDRLTPAEYEVMKTHTVKGAAILETVPSLQTIVPIARHHHERWDGNGYPDRLTGDGISPLARIVAVADAFDAMTSNRPYRPALSIDHAFSELTRQAGAHFDPACIHAFLSLRPQVEAIYRQQDPVVLAAGGLANGR
jgi:putative nucleotidyltransferase with HDIG domain